MQLFVTWLVLRYKFTEHNYKLQYYISNVQRILRNNSNLRALLVTDVILRVGRHIVVCIWLEVQRQYSDRMIW